MQPFQWMEESYPLKILMVDIDEEWQKAAIEIWLKNWNYEK